MKKFGRGKKGEGDDDSSRLALFGSRSKSKSPAPPTNNPYAQPSVQPTPYAQAKAEAGILPAGQQNGDPRPPPRGGRGLPSGPKKAVLGGVNSQNDSKRVYGDDKKFVTPSDSSGDGGGYGDAKYGNAGGYGQDKFGSNAYGGGALAETTSRYGAGGYGGLGRTNTMQTTSTDANRDELFGGARERIQQRGPNGYGQPPPYGTDPAQGPGQERSYGAYGDRQLTAEEEEEEDVAAAKQEIKFLKQQDVSSTRNALRVAAQAEETGRNTLARLGAQGERLHNTDRNLDRASNHQRAAEDKAKELKVANRSMFRMHVDNPFTKGGRDRRDQEILDKHRDEREQREATRQAAFQSGQRINQNFKSVGTAGPGGPKSKSSLAERAKYQFEADSEDDEMEDEIDNNLDEISQVTGRLNLLARAQGDEIEQQNRLLEGLGKKVRMALQHAEHHYADTSLPERQSRRPARHEPKKNRPYPLIYGYLL